MPKVPFLDSPGTCAKCGKARVKGSVPDPTHPHRSVVGRRRREEQRDMVMVEEHHHCR